ncbi:hypothetical protein AMELA_G00071010 [Ameiurus melas]|uniref:non-specific serine/threonine protein kinase n=1 Tax=Ameiurus melas TaxID=219545 RepID=A0A7J6AZ80_AMEME|nr:hypothetical protein AMELA_G00071010 [Ameiurus melas]
MSFSSSFNAFCSQYTKTYRLGKGGCGSVFAGERVADKKLVAIKRVKNPPCITFPGGTYSLPREVCLMEIVNRPRRCENVVELLDWTRIPSSDSVYFLVLERPDKCMDLQKFCQLNNGRVSEPQARKIMWQVVRATHHSFECGVLHRDIKPANLLIDTETQQVKLIDFGCGDLLKDNPYTSYDGTKEFCPPEWFINRKYSGYSATVWSLGVLLFGLVSGRLPFNSKEEIINAQLRFPPGLSGDCCSLISWCLKKDPEERLPFQQILSHMWFNP